MTNRRRCFARLLVLVAVLSIGFTVVQAKDKELDSITAHLKKNYKAKKKGIPFFGLARFAVKLIRPAGVTSIQVALFEELTFSSESASLDSVIRQALTEEWQPIVRMFSKHGIEQTHIYAKEEGKSVRLMVVTVDNNEAVLLKVKVNPEGLAKFLNNPKILGISIGG
jgi:hypothetical protein